jgi:PAS domain S-box-containing protein
MKKRSITSRISILIIIFLGVGVFIAFLANGWASVKQFNAAYEKRLQLETEVLSQSLAGPLWSYNYDAAKTICRAYAAHTDVVLVKVTATSTNDPVYKLSKETSIEVFKATKEIVYDGEVIGAVEIGLSTETLSKNLKQSFFYTVSLMFVIGLIILAGIRYSLTRLIEKPIATLANWAQQIAQGNYQAAAEGSMNTKELAPVARQIKYMSGEIESREKKLNDHIALEETLSRIQQECIAFRKWDQAYRGLLKAAMSTTGSPSGLIAEMSISNPGKVRAVRAFFNIPTGGRGGNVLSLMCEPAIASPVPTIANDILHLPETIRKISETSPISSYVAIPLRRGGETLGVLVLTNRSGGYDQRLLDYLEPLIRGASNMIAAIRDVRALRQSEDMNTAILNGALTGIVTATIDGAILDLNPFALKMFRCSRQEIINKNAVDVFMSESYRAQTRTALAAIKANGTSEILGKTLNIEVCRLDGSVFPAELILTLHQNRYLLTGVMRDVSEEKNAERALRRAQKMEAIGQLTGGIAHDFTNILGIIIGNLEFLMRPELVGGNPKEHLDIAYKAAMRATALTKQLLNFARTKPADAKPTDVNMIISGMNNLLARSVTQQISLRYILAEDLWKANIDPGDLEDSLLNLAINARDAMEGGGELTITTENQVIDANRVGSNRAVPKGQYATLSIRDTGSGISQADQEKIFEPFFSTKDRGKGTGLGLAMVFAFVERSKGYIKVNSKINEGAEFKIFLPRHRSEANEKPDSHTTPFPEFPEGTEWVLAVDDEVDLTNLAKANLSSLGYSVLIANNAAQALKIIDSDQQIDILFTDTVMPGSLNGIELAEEALKRRPELKVLITTGFTNIKGKRPGGQKVLNKPYTKAELADRIRRALDSH